MKMRKKPVVVDVSEPWVKMGDHPDVKEYRQTGNVAISGGPCGECGIDLPTGHGWLETLEGGHRVCPGDRVITGVEGEKYPIKPDIYEKTYESVNPLDAVTDEEYRAARGGAVRFGASMPGPKPDSVDGEPDYTKIQDDRIRGVICDLMSEMLDNPDESGIYPTSRFMWKMESFVLDECSKVGQAEIEAEESSS